jgi:hypothetical protein
MTCRYSYCLGNFVYNMEGSTKVVMTEYEDVSVFPVVSYISNLRLRSCGESQAGY